MSEPKPFLLFPKPINVDSRRRFGGEISVTLPSHARQRARLEPQFRRLAELMELKHAALQLDPSGVTPEQVLVFQTLGPVDTFLTAVRNTPGLEWLAEIEVEDIVPDDDFYKATDRQAPLDGRLFLVMSNQHAIERLLSLWELHKRDEGAKFPRGQSGWKKLFQRLREVRRWDIQDRLLETGVLEDWRRRLEESPDAAVRFEIQLWYRPSAEKRQVAEARVTRLIKRLGGRVLQTCTIEEIAYHALLGDLPATAIQQILRDESVALVRCDDVMYFRPVGQIGRPIPTKRHPRTIVDLGRSVPNELPTGDPVVALLDGVPMENHVLLAGRVRVDDPDDWASEYEVESRIHATAMASLIIHGDLSGPPRKPLATPLYVRPILKPRAVGSSLFEAIPDDCLPVDLLHRAVRRMFEGEGDEPPTAPTVRIINLSVGDPGRVFYHELSPLAKLLDWLSHKYGVLFIVSAGNHTHGLSLEVPGSNLEHLTASEREEVVIRGIAQDARSRRLLSPAESINAVTVGAAHFDLSDHTPTGIRFDPYVRQALPSPIGAIGLGYRRSVKPDLLMPGGRQYYIQLTYGSSSVTIEPVVNSLAPPGLCVAIPALTIGAQAVGFVRGTSGAAALCSGLAARVYDEVVRFCDTHGIGRHFAPVLVKALLVHAASWGEEADFLESVLADCVIGSSREYLARFFGYGLVEEDRALFCTDHRATLVGCGVLEPKKGHEYHVPLPGSLDGLAVWKRLVVTVAWLSPIAANSRRYRGVDIWASLDTSPLDITRRDVDGRATQRGTVQHEVLEGRRADSFHRNYCVIQINCRADALEPPAPIPYGLAVTLEVAETLPVSIYNEIKLAIQTPIEVVTS